MERRNPRTVTTLCDGNDQKERRYNRTPSKPQRDDHSPFSRNYLGDGKPGTDRHRPKYCPTFQKKGLPISHWN